MRWDGQTIEADATGRLPGVRGTVVERRFRAPEAMDLRFYEVQAKSALNRVPNASAVPFKWTINPYRGCTHACAYCLWGETPILLADGRTRALAELRPGDRVYGTERRGAHRRYVPTEVLAHWSTVKQAYRVTLADGTELIASGDHRFLTRRGWKHVMGAGAGAARRPHLTTTDALMGIGALPSAPPDTPDYRLGYLTGLVRGDGHLGEATSTFPGRAPQRRHRLRLALTDFEARRRAERYLDDFEVSTPRFTSASASVGRRAMDAMGTQAAAAVGRVRELVAWPARPSPDWSRGFLAGIFDAEGSWGGHVVRIANTDPELVGRTREAFEGFGFDAVLEAPRHRNGLAHVRLTGGLREVLRFFHLTDPAITRKRTIDGIALTSDAPLGVASVEPLGIEMPMFDITTGTGDFVANGVVSHNCFARPTHEYLDMDAGRDFERRIVVKVNVPEVLRAELARPSWKHEHVALGTNTDPYQWVEGRYKLMRGIWEALRDARNPCSILTKSPLLLRDVDLLREIAAVAEVGACLSVPTLDEAAWRATEPHTPHPRARLEAVAELNRQGIPTGILIAPLMPGINDAPAQVERIIELATEAGAVYIGGNTLHLRGSTRRVFFDWLRTARPDLVPRYEALYRRGAYVPEAQRRHIEHAAGLPGDRLKPYPDRFKHRAAGRQETAGAGGDAAAGRARAGVDAALGGRDGGRLGGARQPAPAQEALF